jgi:hypothetical protein
VPRRGCLHFLRTFLRALAGICRQTALIAALLVGVWRSIVGEGASDGFEHGFLGLPDIHSLAADSRDTTARYLREAVLDLVGVAAPVRATLAAAPYAEPQNSWMAKYLRGVFVGDTNDLAAPDQEYPLFRWSSRLKEFKRTGKTFEITPAGHTFPASSRSGIGLLRISNLGALSRNRHAGRCTVCV